MLNVRSFVVQQISRRFNTNSVKFNIKKQSKLMNKFIKKYNSKGNPLDFLNPLNAASKRKVSPYVKRRVTVLNNVFMQHITDLLSTGEIEPEFLNRNIEISHIDVQPNFDLINIYWFDNNKDTNPDTIELLNSCAYKLKHELCKLHIIGKMPNIQFVEHKDFHMIKYIEEKLKTLDYGEDYEPSTYPYAINQTVTSKSSNTEEDVNKNKDLEDANNAFSVSIPEMRHDVLDLDHHKIMSKIKYELKRSHKNLKKQELFSLTPPPKVDLQNNFLTSTEIQEQLSQFLAQRRREQRYINKQKHCKEDIYNFPDELEEGGGDEEIEFDIEKEEEEEEEEKEYEYEFPYNKD